MATDKTLLDHLNNLSDHIEFNLVTSRNQFEDLLKQKCAIVYIFVDWSGPERLSRYNVFKALSELGKLGPPAFKIDCTDQTHQFVIDWLLKQKDNEKPLYYGGYGETLLLEHGKLVDFISNPGQLGLPETRQKLAKWKEQI